MAARGGRGEKEGEGKGRGEGGGGGRGGRGVRGGGCAAAYTRQQVISQIVKDDQRLPF